MEGTRSSLKSGNRLLAFLKIAAPFVIFGLGLWLGHLGTVQTVRNCLMADTPERVMRACPEWMNRR